MAEGKLLGTGEVVRGKWRVEEMLSKERVYKIKDQLTGEVAAMKVEGNSGVQLLKMEYLVLQSLQRLGKPDICKLIDKGRDLNYQFVIMTLVGKSLWDLKESLPGQRMSLSSALRIGVQCLNTLADLHSVHFVHRDVKPGNFAIGREEVGEHRTVMILDFGFARKFIDDEGEYRMPRTCVPFRGTPRYAPLCCHRDKEQGRKDDLESWLYQQVELTVGRLPWHNNNEMRELGKLKKVCRLNGSLFHECPVEYQEILNYIDSLSVMDEPDYAYIRGLLRQAMTAHGIQDHHLYDWETPALSNP